MPKMVCLLVMLSFAAIAAGQTKTVETSTPQGSAKAADSGSVRKAIEEANAKFLAAMKGGDAKAAASNYSEDAIVMMPGEPAWKGRAAILNGLDGFLKAMTMKEGATHTEDVMVGGSMAVETGTFEWTLQPKSGAAVKDKGKYLTVWRRQPDGTWKIVRDINNTDLPQQ